MITMAVHADPARLGAGRLVRRATHVHGIPVLAPLTVHCAIEQRARAGDVWTGALRAHEV